MMKIRPRQVALVLGVVTVASGVWAFAAPESFYKFATYPPYNVHFIHDIGAFLIGLGAVLLLATRFQSALYVALAGNAIGAWMHFLSHVIDRTSDASSWREILPSFIIAAVLTAGAGSARKA